VGFAHWPRCLSRVALHLQKKSRGKIVGAFLFKGDVRWQK
jgi:hypothetical protein